MGERAHGSNGTTARGHRDRVAAEARTAAGDRESRAAPRARRAPAWRRHLRPDSRAACAAERTARRRCGAPKLSNARALRRDRPAKRRGDVHPAADVVRAAFTARAAVAAVSPGPGAPPRSPVAPARRQPALGALPRRGLDHWPTARRPATSATATTGATAAGKPAARRAPVAAHHAGLAPRRTARSHLHAGGSNEPRWR
jgi:hypothetical protein